MDTWFESGLLAIAPTSFKVLRSGGLRTTAVGEGTPAPVGGNHTCHWKSGGRYNLFTTVHHLHTAVLISEEEGWGKSDSRHLRDSWLPTPLLHFVCVASYGEVTGISRHPACLSAPREAPQQRVSGSHLDQLRNSSGSHCRPNIGRPTVYPGRP